VAIPVDVAQAGQVGGQGQVVAGSGADIVRRGLREIEHQSQPSRVADGKLGAAALHPETAALPGRGRVGIDGTVSERQVDGLYRRRDNALRSRRPTGEQQRYSQNSLHLESLLLGRERNRG
jgi:hypothetical protein